MSKQSSRIYGIKVKEHRNYYEYPHSDDPEIDISEIKIYYDKNAINKWIIKSNYNSIWYNGTAYPVGSIILAFKDGTDCTNKPFMLMAPHEENGIIVNYFYRITGRFSTVPPVEELLIEQEDVPLEPTVDDSDSIRYTIESGHPNAHYDQLYVRKFVNDVEVGHQIVTAESIRAHQVAHSSNYYNYLKVFNALLFDWNGMLPRIEDSYTFTLYSNVTYLEITPTTYQKGWKIKSWNWDTPVNLNILDFSRQPEPAPVDEHDNIKFNVATNENNPDAINIDKVVNNAVVSTKTYSANDILAYRNSHNNEPIVVYENLLLDFYEETYPGYKFYLRANSNYLKYEDNWIKFGDTITSWGYNDIVNFEINDYSNRYENEIKENTTYNVLVEHIVWRDGYYASVDPSVSLTSDDVCYDIFYDHLEMYYNNHYHKAAWLVYDQPSEGYKRIGKLAIMWAKPFWVLITTADGVRWNGTTYKGRKLLKMWHEDEAVDMTMTREQSRKVIAKGQDYDDILYVITTAESSNDLTVIKRINDLDDDTIVFDPETDCPVDFHNIRFTYSGGKIHVYSKCDFIYLSGSNYKKGRDIIDWPLEEKVNFGIKDETNAYEIINTATYTVKSEEVTVTDYDISTLIDEHWTPLKVCKIVNNKESDDEIIYFYDCSINPFVYDEKLEISYDPASTYWTLTSLSDEIYMDNVQYPEGTVIATWPFGSDEHIYGIGHSDISHYDVRLHSVEVDSSASYETTHEYITDPRYFIVTQSDHSLNLTNDQPGSPPVTRNIRYMDALNWYQFFQIKIKYDVTDSDWIIKSDSNELFIGQDRYKKGEIISKWDYYDDVDSTISVLIEDIKHTTREEKVKDLLVSNKSSWLYGYIWQREETPPPPVWVHFYLLYTVFSWGSGTYNQYGSLRFIDDRDLSHIKNKKQLQISGYSQNPYAIIKYNYSFLNRIFVMYYSYYSNRQELMICDNITDTNPEWDWISVDVSNFYLSFVKDRSTFIGRSVLDCNIYYEYTIFEDHTVRKTLEKDISELQISTGFYYDCTYSCNLFVRPFGSNNKVIYIADLDHDDYTSNYALYIYEPYNDRMTEYGSVSSIPALSDYTRDHTITTYNRHNILPEDLGKINKYCYFHIGPSGGMGNYIKIKDEFGNYDNIYRYDQYKEFLDGNTFYAFGEITIETWEVYSYSVGTRIYYDDRRIDVDHNYVRIELTPSGSSIEIIEPTEYNLFPCIYEGYSYIPETCFLFFTGTYEFNGDKYFIGLKYNKINDPSYAVYDIGNIYGIFKFNKETKLIDKVREINGENPIYINRIDISTGEIVGTEEFYWKYDYDSNKNHIFYNTTMDGGAGGSTKLYSDNTACRAFVGTLESYINVSAIPSDNYDKVIISVGKSNKRIYVVFDNPTFSSSVGNYCFYEDSHDY